MGYKPTGQTQIRKMTPTGASVIQYRAWIVTEHGATGSVDVDEADWTEEKLKPILDELAAKLDLPWTLAK
jgi:hypothetical protein